LNIVKKYFKRIVAAGLLATVVFTGLAATPSTNVNIDNISINTNAYTEILSIENVNAYAIIEPTGSQIHKSRIILRFDLYLTPDAPGYNLHHVEKLIIPKEGYTGKAEEYQHWLDNLPTKWVDNPFLCVFVTVNTTDNNAAIKDLVQTITVQAYNYWVNNTGNLRNVNTIINPILRPNKLENDKTSIIEKAIRLHDILTNKNDFAINPNLSIGLPSNLSYVYAADPIDVGSAATNRGGSTTITSEDEYTSTNIDYSNAANDDGSIDTVEIWLTEQYSGCSIRAATFDNTTGTTFVCRDVEVLGDVSSGSKQTFSGLDMTIETGDYIGLDDTGTADIDDFIKIESDGSGGDGVYYVGGSHCVVSNSASYNLRSGDVLSLYGTGETAGASLSTVTTQAATNIEDTTATGNGNITNTGGDNADIRGIVWDLSTHGDPGNTSPAASDYDNDVAENGDFGTGAFTRSLTSLPTGDTIYARAYAHNSEGYAYGVEVNFLTKPAAPTNVAATDGVHTDKVVITWTKSTGATGYKVYEGANLLDTLGDVATYDDSAAAAGIITPGTATASDGTSTLHVVLSLAGESVANGASRTYKVVALNGTGDSDDSGTNTGYRGTGALTLQWQRSDADADAAYNTNIVGGTTDPYNDTDGVVTPDGRYYRAVLDATGTAQQISTVDRGYKSAAPTTPTITNSTGASLIEDTTARLNGNLTDDGNVNATVYIYWGLTDGVTTILNWDNEINKGVLGEGAFFSDIDTLPTGTTIYYRCYATNSEGNDWANSTESFLTKPAAPTNVSATDGGHTDKVVITWTKSFGATGYKVYEGANLLDTLGDVATYDDNAAAAGIITPGTADASDGTTSLHVVLILGGESVANGAARTYKVVALNGTGDSDASETDNGYRGVGAITYQWQRSAGDADAGYGDIIGATTDPYNDVAGVVDPDGRWYQCVLDATGTTQQTSAANRGYKAAWVAPTITTNIFLGFGGTWAVLSGTIDNEGDATVTEIGFNYGLTNGYGDDWTLTGSWNTGDSFVGVVTGLSRATVFHYQAKANNTQWGYGEDKLFSTKGSAVVYEHLNTGGDADSADIYANNWGAQYFTVGATSHTVTFVNVYIKRTGSPGTVTVSIKHATGVGSPTGTDLVSTTIDGDVLSDSYTWVKIDLTETSLEADMEYAIVIRANAGDDANDIQWREDDGGGLADAGAYTSTNGGVSWSIDGGGADYLFEVWGNPCIDLISVKVFRGYLPINPTAPRNDWIQSDDMLFVIHYENIYPPYFPSDDSNIYFYLQLLDTDGVTVLHQTPCKQWGSMPGAIYLSADTAAGLESDVAYYIRLYGNFTGNPSAQYQLTAADWRGSDLFYFDNWIILMANTIGEYYTETLGGTVTFTEYVSERGDVLNDSGNVIFSIGIPGLSVIRPGIFKSVKQYPVFPDTAPENLFSSAENWEDMMGTEVVTIAENLGEYAGGIDAKTIAAIALLGFALALSIGIFAKGHATVGLALTFPFIAAAGALRVLDIAIIAIIGIIALLLFVWSIWWSRT